MIDRILVRGVNWIGDAVMTIPALRALRRYFKESEISLLVKPWVAPVFYDSPYLDNIILYPSEADSLMGKWRLAETLKREGFTKAILLQNAFDAALIAFLAGVPERIGYSRDMRGILLTKRIPYSAEDRRIHHIEYYLELLRRAGIPADYSQPWIKLSISERLEARRRLASLKRPVLAINPGASYGSAKRWFPQRFAKIADAFMDYTGGSVVLLGGEKEIDITKDIRKSINGEDIMILTGKTTLRELIAVISECDILLSNDSGPMHIGYAVGTPLVAIFGSTSPELTGPRGFRDIVIKKDINCSPCFKRTCETMTCMDGITEEEVFGAVKSLIPSHRAVFFDRDGTLCKDRGYLNDLSGLEVFEDITELRRLRDAGFKLIGVTNQSGIARGIVEEENARKINSVFIERYGFDDFYYCPHHPDEHCECRKPEPGMLLRARAVHNIDLKKSWVVGDKISDILLAKAAGARSILLKTGELRENPEADHLAASLKEVVEIILSNS
ncbi:MAG: lipopolysaccharide heptosyltransferase II [Thermodesulfovibrionales bacterium]|nr:lipopolysaccharide heptosyltransferase II [Thermodesulfovibrionales bacterium]